MQGLHQTAKQGTGLHEKNITKSTVVLEYYHEGNFKGFETLKLFEHANF